MGTWFRRLAYLLRQRQHEAELREEIETHRALRAAQLQREGLTARDAAGASRRALGNSLLAREDVRDAWLGSWPTWWQDVRYGLRVCRRNPGFTAAAVVTLALGIGVNTGIFSVMNAVLFRGLTAPDAGQLVSISQAVQGVPELAGQEVFSTAEYFAYRDRAQTLSGLVAFGNARGEATLDGDTPRKIRGALVSCNFFDVLRQPPALGRGFQARDCEPGAELVVLLSHELWQTAFGADPGVVGRTIQLNRQPVTVAGVTAVGTYDAAATFHSGGYVAPLNAGTHLASGDGRYEDEKHLWLFLFGRRRDGIRVEQVRKELDVVAAQIDRQWPGRSTRLTVERARPAMSERNRTAATGAAAMLMSSFGLILLIACANVANLLLARGAARTQEIGVRVSLGASRARLVRQLMTESLLLSLMGGLLGSVAALWSFRLLVALAGPALLPPWLPIAMDLSPDARVFGFAVALTAVTGVLFGVAPAVHASRPDLHSSMKLDSPATGSRRGGSLRATLVGGQVALCMVLMVAAGLLLRGLQVAYTIDPGFAYRNVVLISLESAFEGYSEEEATARRTRLIADLTALPGVDAIGSADHKPLGDDSSPAAIRLPREDAPPLRVGERTAVSENYFSVLELPIVRGRAFTPQEVRNQRSGPRPAIVSETTARNLWPGVDPIGRTLLAGPPRMAGAEEMLQVVGVVRDAQLTALGRIDAYSVYVPGPWGDLLVQTRVDVTTTISNIRAAVRAIDPALVLTVLPLEASLGQSRGISATVTALFGALGVLALLLAAVGIYGVVSFAVTGRHQEIGIRLALGATARSVLGLILRQTMRPVVVGAVIGIAGASALSRVLSSVLFGLSPVDPLGLGGAALLVLGVALTAGLLAARPAAGTNPTAALRSE